MTSTVHVVHCIDTEGPMWEGTEATFQRLNEIFGLDLAPSTGLLSRLQNKQIPLNGLEDEVARVIAPELLKYNHSWDLVDDMLRRIMSRSFRDRLPDSFGRGWVYNWHTVDHVGYADNPRRRDIGMHNVFDHYRFMVKDTASPQDGLHFHYHPMSISRKAHHCATHYFTEGNELYQILARRIIDRGWFPSVFRPGFHAERPDSQFFLEQFIPFDYANQSGGPSDMAGAQDDAAHGRYGDWRRAPRDWAPYHPSHDDWQMPGSCRRYIMRIRNVGTRFRLLEQDDVDQAFSEAADGRPVILAFADHDYRDIGPDVDYVRGLLRAACERYPHIRFRYSEARDAVRSALKMDERAPTSFRLELRGKRLFVEADQPIFGPQPFLALKTRGGRYHHDNFDFEVAGSRWAYVFDDHTVPLSALEQFGFAACDFSGNVTVVRWNPDDSHVA